MTVPGINESFTFYPQIDGKYKLTFVSTKPNAARLISVDLIHVFETPQSNEGNAEQTKLPTSIQYDNLRADLDYIVLNSHRIISQERQYQGSLLLFYFM